MTITFKTENDVIIYALKKIISYARDNQYIFVTQSIWWISSIIGLQQELVRHIDKLKVRTDIGRTRIPAESVECIEELNDQRMITTGVLRKPQGPFLHPDRISSIEDSTDSYIGSKASTLSTSEDDIHNEIIQHYEELLKQSQRERKILGQRNRQVSRAVVRPYIRIWPCMRVYDKIRLQTWMW